MWGSRCGLLQIQVAGNLPAVTGARSEDNWRGHTLNFSARVQICQRSVLFPPLSSPNHAVSETPVLGFWCAVPQNGEDSSGSNKTLWATPLVHHTCITMGNVTYNEGHRVNDRGQRLFTVEYLCEQAPRALLFWQHGYGEHMGRYRSGALTVFMTPGVWSSPSRSTLRPCSASK